jgi:uncharacterized membrane protein YgdD (TMEM256/DUF423 family)
MQRHILVSASWIGFTGVVIGAFGAHALHERILSLGMEHVWDTAVLFQLLHAACLLGLSALVKTVDPRALPRLAWSARGWTVGTVLFSGSLYALALGGPRWLGPITPLGGLALMVGWVAAIAATFALAE